MTVLPLATGIVDPNLDKLTNPAPIETGDGEGPDAVAATGDAGGGEGAGVATDGNPDSGAYQRDREEQGQQQEQLSYEHYRAVWQDFDLSDTFGERFMVMKYAVSPEDLVPDWKRLKAEARAAEGQDGPFDEASKPWPGVDIRT